MGSEMCIRDRVKTAFIIASVHAMAVITLMESAITDVSPVGKDLIAAKVSIHIVALICHMYHLFHSLREFFTHM